MFPEFEIYIKEQASLSGDDIELMRAKAIEKTLRRKDILVHQGDVCRYKIFVTKGLLRAYTAHEDGSEHIMHFSPENSWFTDPESFANATPSNYTIEALEHSEVILWTKNDLRYLVGNIPGLKAYFDKLIYKAGTILRHRLHSAISSTAEEKYEEFIKNHADIHARVPLHMVASYLGVTRETLSRIRRSHAITK
jgi:CRP-like cAMP-binding protein